MKDSLNSVAQSIDVLNRLQQAIDERDYLALLPITDAYYASVRRLDKASDRPLTSTLLAAHKTVETSLYQLRDDVEAMIHQTTQDKIKLAYQAV
ncbi:hypothetical protein [Rosenbergiella australiborealis]|uniref:Uncharacterized protein n=1 Tax=Rosenbergiella australiborealis TaxID=1544696 RepID=A0ABS5T923_9GAMM|nr:hypothetical protein [Rosenbergiella australiborealis]MBT0728223.1 hypothetical protein [Rosenbergiella australiborealis]